MGDKLQADLFQKSTRLLGADIASAHRQEKTQCERSENVQQTNQNNTGERQNYIRTVELATQANRVQREAETGSAQGYVAYLERNSEQADKDWNGTQQESQNDISD